VCVEKSLWRTITYTLHDEIRWFKSLLKCSKINLKFIFRLHHQPSIEHDTILFYFDKLSVHYMHVYPSQEWIKHFDSCIFDIIFGIWIFFLKLCIPSHKLIAQILCAIARPIPCEECDDDGPMGKGMLVKTRRFRAKLSWVPRG
jgi:hypothetical protein